MIYKVKRNYYKNILKDHEPDAIFILGGDSINHKIQRRTLQNLATLLYKGSNPNLISGVEARIYAAVELSNYFQTAKIVVMSHKTVAKGNNTFKKELPTYAEKTAKRLNEKGIPLERILLCKRSTSTLTELMETIKLSSFSVWKTVIVITNQYHIERAQLLFYLLTHPLKKSHLFNLCYKELENEEDKELFRNELHTFHHALTVFQSHYTQVFFIAAEVILPEKYVFYEKVIDSVYMSEAYKNMATLEERGVAMILKGSYNFDHNHTLTDYLHYQKDTKNINGK